MLLYIVRSGCVLVLDHLLGLVGDSLVDPLQCLLGSEQVVLLQELATLLGEAVELPGISLPAVVIIESDFFNDVSVDQLLNMLIDGGLAHAGVEFLEFVHRRELVGMLEDVVDEGESRLLGNEVDQFTGFHPFGGP